MKLLMISNIRDAIRRILIVAAISITASMAFTPIVNAQTLNVTICSQNATAYNINGSAALAARQKLSNSALFGPTGSFCDVNFSYVTLPSSTVTEAALIASGCDVVWSGYELDSSWTAAERTQLQNWADNGNGQVIAGCDNATHDPICEHIGLGLNSANVSSGTSSVVSNVQGCFPNASSVLNNGGGSVTNFQTVPVGLNTITNQIELAPTSPSAVFGSGILATSDVNMYVRDSGGCCLSAGVGITNSNDQFLGDAMCSLAQASQGGPSCFAGEASLTLLKTVINDNAGTAPETAFALTATGPTTITGTEGDAAITAAIVTEGAYTLSEVLVAGYSQTGLSCSGAADSDLSDGLDIAAGEKVICVFINDDDASQTTLTIEKTASIDPVVPGTPFNYVITASNAADGIAATNVVVTDILDGSLSLNSVVASSGGTVDNTVPQVGCTWGTIPDGGSETCTINVTP